MARLKAAVDWLIFHALAMPAPASDFRSQPASVTYLTSAKDRRIARGAFAPKGPRAPFTQSDPRDGYTSGGQTQRSETHGQHRS